jgi:hypothetical protein
MHRAVLSAGLALLFAPPIAAQQAEEQAPTQVYVAYSKISYADLEDWIQIYHEHSVPILQELVDEGTIVGWNVWQHSTGGEYNWRFAVLAGEWSQFGEFWGAYLGRLEERAPDASARAGAMIQAHYDEIWDLTEVNVPDDLDYQYVYDSKFQISFAEMDEWNRTWTEVAGPILNQAMEDGILGGWVLEGHNTGGRYNWKVLYFFEEWDDMDDLFERLLSQLTADAERWQRIGNMMAAHDDVIWASVPDPAGN